MTTTTMHSGSHGFMRLMGDFAGMVRQRARQRQAERLLMGMDDAMLSDIGIERAEIPYLVRHGRG